MCYILGGITVGKDHFKAFRLTKKDNKFNAAIDTLSKSELPQADVLVKVNYSSVNYKDGLACLESSSIVKQYPFVPGIDLAGEVVESSDQRFKVGDLVLATGYEIGVTHYGGFSEYARIPGDWLVPLPNGLSEKEAMTYGTAGFTAALSIHRLEENGISPEMGSVLVTGATGGVGSTAIAMLHKRGYKVIASTGKQKEYDYLKRIGASEIITREQVYEEKVRALDKQQWAAAVDPVGGHTLASVLSKIQYGGSVAVSGLTGGGSVPTTVYPFILRGVNLLGIDSVFCPMEIRKKLWERMGEDLKPNNFTEMIANEITLDDLPDALPSIMQGNAKGRTVVKL